jgi:hypothetical protein
LGKIQKKEVKNENFKKALKEIENEIGELPYLHPVLFFTQY